MATFLTQGIPLKLQQLPHDNMLAVLYTRDKGKVVARIRGGKKIKGKLIAPFNSFSELDVMVARGRYFDIIAGARSRLVFFDLQTNLSKRLIALTMLDVVHMVTVEHELDDTVYDFLVSWLMHANHHTLEDDKIFLSLSLWRLLTKVGFAPDIDICFLCHKDLSMHYFSEELHAFLCPDCGLHKGVKVSTELIQLLRVVQTASTDKVAFNHITQAADIQVAQKKLSDMIAHMIQHFAEFELKGLNVYNSIMS